MACCLVLTSEKKEKQLRLYRAVVVVVGAVVCSLAIHAPPEVARFPPTADPTPHAPPYPLSLICTTADASVAPRQVQHGLRTFAGVPRHVLLWMLFRDAGTYVCASVGKGTDRRAEFLEPDLASKKIAFFVRIFLIKGGMSSGHLMFTRLYELYYQLHEVFTPLKTTV